MRARRAQRETDRHLPPPRNGARQLQARDVDGRHDQEQEHTAEKCQQQAARIADDGGLQDLDLNAALLVERRVLLLESRSNSSEIASRRFEGDTVFETPERTQPTRAAIGREAWRVVQRQHGGRHPHVGVERHAGESGRHHANHRHRAIVQRDGALQHVRICCERAAPERVADHHHGVFVRHRVFLGGERAPKGRLCSKQREVSGRHELGLDAEGAFAGLHVQRVLVVDGDVLERRVHGPPVEDLGDRTAARRALRSSHAGQEHQTAGVGEGQRSD